MLDKFKIVKSCVHMVLTSEDLLLVFPPFISGLNGAMSDISVGYGSRPHTPTKSRSRTSDLNAFITEELHRHTEARKRAPPTPDVAMDSPTHKRSRLS